MSGMGPERAGPDRSSTNVIIQTTEKIMSFGLNRAEVIGRLGADVTVNHLVSGGRVANLSIGRVGGWRGDCRVRWLVRCFRSGPQSVSHSPVSSPPLIKPDVRFSRIRLSDEIMPSRSEWPRFAA